MSVAPSRRALLLVAPFIAATPARAQLPGTGVDRLRQQWGQFRNRFMAPDGRIIDTGNRNISHSEGQGWGMLMALAADDRASFERIWAWTRRTLDRPRDALSAWRFRPQAANPVEDMNNATDGDLFLAWALLEAGRIWGATQHTESGQAIGRDILRLLVRPAGGMALLLPGARGFERRDHIIVNPSYYCFPALRVLAAAVPDPAWLRVAGDGLSLLRAARFGRWGLPPDWLSVHKQDRRLTLPSNWAPRFSYDAVRVPLYLGWVGLGQEPALQAAADFWTDSGHRQMPAWTDLSSNAVSPYTASPGIAAVAGFAAQMARRPIPVAERRAPDAMPDYYSGALSALVSLARRDSGADFW